jgi:hypothetical protein
MMSKRNVWRRNVAPSFYTRQGVTANHPHNCTRKLSIAMATEAPDPRTFQRWEDAFQYPVPIVRKLEQQLRNNADENREKLRSLVG